MYDFESLMAEVMKARPELTRDDLMKRIEEKKETVGAGYLTSQGALFLVAGELGVSLERDASSDLGVKDMFVGANDVTLVARVLALYPTSMYDRKDGGKGKYRRMVVFDNGGQIKATLWEEKADEAEKEGIAMDSAVRLSNAYVKQGLDGKAAVNLGKRGKVSVVTDKAIASKLPTVEGSAVPLPKLTDEKSFVALKAVVSSEPRFSEFVRSDGSPGSLFQFGVNPQGSNAEVRVVVWSPSAQPQLAVGQKVVLTNVRSRRSNRGDFEVHGDAGSAIMPDSHREVVEMRVVGLSKDGKRTLVAGVDRDRRVRFVEASFEPSAIGVGEAVRVTPDRESGGRLFCPSPDSLVAIGEDGLPQLDALTTKVKDVKDETSQIMLEVIALSHGAVEDVRLKDGSTVKKGELVVGDDTGETRLVGWRENSSRVEGIQPGERLRVVGVTGRPARATGWNLQISGSTMIQRMKGR